MISFRKNIINCAMCGVGLLSAMPAFAETDIEELKRELAEQKQLIQKLLMAQDSQKTSDVKAQSSTPVPSNKAKPANGPLIPGLTFYGTLDVNASSSNSGFGHKTTIGSGGMSASSFGVKGERNLGGESKVVGEFEAGLAIDTGAVSNGAVTPGINSTFPSTGGLLGTGPQLFARQAYVGLEHSQFGRLTIGRQYAGSYMGALGTGNAMYAGYYGNANSLLAIVGGLPTRLNNSIAYRTPALGGFSAQLLYTTGNENNVATNVASGATTTNDRAGRGIDLAIFYRSAPFNGALTAWNFNNSSFVSAGENDLAKRKGGQIAANYNFGVATLFGHYIFGTISGGNYENVTKTLSKASAMSVSAKIPFGASAVLVSWGKIDDKSLLNKDASIFGLAYTYDLRKDTKLYVNWGRVNNSSAATYSLVSGGDIVGNVITGGVKPSGIMMGLNVSF